MTEETEAKLEKYRHSRLGIASVIMAIVIPVIWISFLVAGMLISSRYSIGKFIGIAAMIFALLAPLSHFVGSILGLVGCFTKDTRRGFSIAGAILNALLGVSGIVIIWLFLSNMSWGFR